MGNLNAMTPAERSAAMRGGMVEWGCIGGLLGHIRYLKPVEPNRRRRCGCGCEQRGTHYGCANGVVLTVGCELSMRRWEKAGEVRR